MPQLRFRLGSINTVLAAALMGFLVLLGASLTSSQLTGATLLVGNNSVQTGTDNDAPGLAEAFQYTATSSGSIGSLSLYVDSGSAAKSIDIGVYKDYHGRPGTLLAKGVISSPRSASWNTVAVSGASSAVTSGSSYWLALVGIGGQVNFRDVASGGRSQNSRDQHLSTLSNRWSGGANWANSPASFYASTGSGVTATPAPTPTSTPHSTATPTATPTSRPTSTPTPHPTSTPAPTSTPTPIPTSTPNPVAGTDCFAAPGKCGYPDPNYNNVGATNACSLPVTNQDVTVNSNTAPLQNMNIHGSITVNAANVTINNVCVSENGEGNINNGDAVRFNAPGGTIEHSTIHGANATNQSVEIAIGGEGTASFDYLYNCGECVHDGPWTVNDSYVITNGDPYSGGYNGNSPVGEEDHFEDLYMSDNSATLIHDTLLNPQGQTAVLFGDNYGGQHTGAADNHWVITNNLIAGGGYTFYLNARGTSQGSSSISVTGNRFARCGTTNNMSSWEDSGGGYDCPGGANQYGYSPLPGYYGLNYGVGTYCTNTNWTGNIWDDNQTTVSC